MTLNKARLLPIVLVLVATVLLPAHSRAERADRVIFGIKAIAGGRYDNVRMCVATEAGVPGGPAFDIALFAEFGVSETMSIAIDLPVMRPVLFAIASDMLQFEPDVSLLVRHTNEDGFDIVYGPTLGLSLHYGPDFESAVSGAGRRPSFFAMGPRIGGYVGLDFDRPGKTFNFQLGLHPYFTPLFAIDDPADHTGVVVGASLDGTFRFDLSL